MHRGDGYKHILTLNLTDTQVDEFQTHPDVKPLNRYRVDKPQTHLILNLFDRYMELTNPKHTPIFFLLTDTQVNRNQTQLH